LSIGSPGGSATDTANISSVQGFSGSVNLSCIVSYSGEGTPHDLPTCAISPNQGSVSPSSSLSATVKLSTTASTTAHGHNSWPVSGEVLAAMFFVGFLRRRGSPFPAVLLAIVLIGVSAGCGGGGPSTPSGGRSTNAGTTTGSYQVVVVATTSTGSTSKTISLTVQ
jgi:hypothetical protein